MLKPMADDAAILDLLPRPKLHQEDFNFINHKANDMVNAKFGRRRILNINIWFHAGYFVDGVHLNRLGYDVLCLCLQSHRGHVWKTLKLQALFRVNNSPKR